MRRVRGLKSVEEVAPPRNRQGGTKEFAPSAGDGLRYEKQVAMYAASLGLRIKHGQWFRYRDQKGVAYCQTDVLALPVEQANRLIVAEVKLTQKAEGELKLDKLYVPLMKAMYKIPVFPVLVFRNKLWHAERQVARLQDLLDLPVRESGKVYHLHWSAL